MIVVLIAACIIFIIIIYTINKSNKDLEKQIKSLKEDKSHIEHEYHKFKTSCDNLSRDLISTRNNYYDLANENDKLSRSFEGYKELKELNTKREESLKIILEGHKKAFPYLASIMADYITYDIQVLADQLNWGSNKVRAKKVASINEIRASANERIAEAKVATYQLNYLLSLYPALEDVLDRDEYNELDYSDKGYLKGSADEEEDPVRLYLSDDEWYSLSEDERNQRALDKYVKSHTKTKWQIGRDYELFIGYLYECGGYEVEYFGEDKGLEDLGRDLICKRLGKTQIVQCKYWSKEKTIHEKHIFQLYATTISYCLDNHMEIEEVIPVFVTNTVLSEVAKRVAKQLKVSYRENKEIEEFPRIKCNNGANGKIYHLPMDQQYDKVQLIHKGDKRVFTVKEAVDAGFRRAYKWKPFL